MNIEGLFPGRPESRPTIYAYAETRPDMAGLLKVGYTDRPVEARMAEHFPTKRPDGTSCSYRVELVESAMRPDGSCFMDHDVHRVLEARGFLRQGRSEWFRCNVKDVRSAVVALRSGEDVEAERTLDFEMRPEQAEAVEKTYAFYKREERRNSDRHPRFLWNAKMRFGKTFATYELAKKLEAKRVLILTFKPAVESAWRDDLLGHRDFAGWQFVSNKNAANENVGIDAQYDATDKERPIVCFGSFQDLLGKNDSGGIKAKNEFIHLEDWDLVIFDEYHFGAWRDTAAKLFKKDRFDEEQQVDFDVEAYQQDEAGNALDETYIEIDAKYYLYLSGTPFRAINSGEFIEDQIFNWTYSDEQTAKRDWKGPGANPYAALPQMVMLTYRLPESIRQVAIDTQFNEFDLNVFFSAEGEGEAARFIYANEVQQWLDLIRGAYLPGSVENLKLGAEARPPMPFSDVRLLNVLFHTLWFLPNVAACDAMENLLNSANNRKPNAYGTYTVVNASGTKAGIGLDALGPVRRAMGDPLKTKTITLSCGKLTTGVTVRPWTGVFMLRNLKSPETYFQTAFRVQSPWTITDKDGRCEILKKTCYVFDFSLDRALRQIADYSCRLNVEESNPEKKVGDFINFLPVLAYDGSTMQQVDAQEILDIAMSGTSATLLAKRWESALLVNVDNKTLEALRNNPQAMKALESIEGFRSLNKDIATIISNAKEIKKAKKEGEAPTKKEAKILTEKEKETKSLRKTIQEKLIKFATRVPIFMYLSDYRERSLKDVISQLEPSLFKAVTGLAVKDFELLVSLNVFNGPLMNDAVFKFKRYEDGSISYTGIDPHAADETVGGWDTAMDRKAFDELYRGQQRSMDGDERLPVKLPRAALGAGTENIAIQAGEVVEAVNKKSGNRRKGVVTRIVKNFIHVAFDDAPGAPRRFQYPQAFLEGYLSLAASEHGNEYGRNSSEEIFS
ncbi:MAG: GIY-YIG nuclease family protein [Kiritimatiellia bacterium]